MLTTALNIKDQNQVTQKTRISQEFDLKASINLALKTKEGDRISYSLDKKYEFSKLEEELRFVGDGETFEFSLSARATSEYSLQMEGDLNEEEIVAIRTLTQTLAPIVKSFVTEVGFDVEQAQEGLAKTLGVIQHVEVSLGKNFQASLNVQKSLRGSIDDLEPWTKNFETPDLSIAIRNLNSLVRSVVNSIFHPLEVEFPENLLIQTLGEFKNFLAEQMLKFLNPKPHVASEVILGDSSDQVEKTALTSESEEPVSQPETQNFGPIMI